MVSLPLSFIHSFQTLFVIASIITFPTHDRLILFGFVLFGLCDMQSNMIKTTTTTTARLELETQLAAERTRSHHLEARLRDLEAQAAQGISSFSH